MQAVEDEFDARGNAQLVEYVEKIVPDDSGSTLLGFSVAFLSLDYCRAQPASHSALIFPAIATGFPVFDAMLAVLRRLRRGRSPFDGDRRHFYDLLRSRGWRARSVTLACYGISLAFVAAARVEARGFAVQPSWLAVFVVGAFFVLALCLGSLAATEPGPQPERIRSGNAAR